jgi:hypothetical protein
MLRQTPHLATSPRILESEMVRRKLKEMQMHELNTLRDRCSLVLEFLNRRGELGDLARQIDEVIQQAHATHDLRGLRILQRDLDDWSRDLPSDDQVELETLLRVRLLVDPEQERAADIAKLRQIEERGQIRNEREYRLVQARAEELRASTAGAEEVQRLDVLLANY